MENPNLKLKNNHVFSPPKPSNSTTNAASRRTRQKIRTAFAELIQEKKSISNLHVTDLVKRADITRGTFYRHYDNLNQVAQDFQTEISQAFFADDDHRPLQLSEIDLYFDRLAHFLADHAETYRMLLDSNDAVFFLSEFSQRLNQKFYHLLTLHDHSPHDHPELLLEVNFFVGGVATLLLKYFRAETDLSIDQINHYIKRKFHQTFLHP